MRFRNDRLYTVREARPLLLNALSTTKTHYFEGMHFLRHMEYSAGLSAEGADCARIPHLAGCGSGGAHRLVTIYFIETNISYLMFAVEREKSADEARSGV